ncbi:MAG: TonB-dependent receptor [Candidatus Eisenbacteria bacterium]
MKSTGFTSIVVATLCLILSVPALAQEERTREDLLFMEIPKVVAAAKFEQSASDAPATVAVITAEEIKRHGYETLEEALRTVAGVHVTYDRNYHYIGVRGYSVPGDWNSRVLLLVNGCRRNEDVYGSGYVGSAFGIDMDQIERIEVVKGPGSALYGTNAFFAVVNVVTKDGTGDPGLAGWVQYGSYDSRKLGFSYGRADNGLDLSLGASYGNVEGQDLYFREYDGYVDEAGFVHDGVFRDGDGDQTFKLFGRLNFKGVSLQAGFNSREKGIPTASYWTAFNDNRTRNTDELAFAEARYEYDISSHRNVMGRLSLNRYLYHGDWAVWYEGEDGFYKELGKDLATGRWVNTELQFNWSALACNRLTIGAEGEYHHVHQKYWDAGLPGPEYYQLYLDDTRDFGVWSLYAQDVLQLANMSFVLGVRHDQYPASGGTTNPRLGWIYTLRPATGLKLLYGTAFRAPSLNELHYGDGGHTLISNGSLEPERLKTVEAVLQQEIGCNLRATLSTYDTRIENLIYQVVTDQLGLDGLELLQYQNTGAAKARGLEVGLQGFLAGLQVHATYARQKAVEETYGEELPNSPRDIATVGVGLPKLWDSVLLSAEVRYIGRRFTVARETLDPHACTDLVLVLDGTIPRLELTAKVRNLFDEAYEDPASTEHLQTSIPQDRRNFYVKATYRF